VIDIFAALQAANRPVLVYGLGIWQALQLVSEYLGNAFRIPAIRLLNGHMALSSVVSELCVYFLHPATIIPDVPIRQQGFNIQKKKTTWSIDSHVVE
jgi:hypothetical protein